MSFLDSEIFKLIKISKKEAEKFPKTKAKVEDKYDFESISSALKYLCVKELNDNNAILISEWIEKHSDIFEDD